MTITNDIKKCGIEAIKSILEIRKVFNLDDTRKLVEDIIKKTGASREPDAVVEMLIKVFKDNPLYITSGNFIYNMSVHQKDFESLKHFSKITNLGIQGEKVRDFVNYCVIFNLEQLAEMEETAINWKLQNVIVEKSELFREKPEPMKRLTEIIEYFKGLESHLKLFKDEGQYNYRLENNKGGIFGEDDRRALIKFIVDTMGDATQEEKIKTYNLYMGVDLEDLIVDYAVAKQEYDLNN